VLDRCFELRQRGATLGGEIRGGLTTFMVMAYIIFVNPAILSFAGIPSLQGQGPPFSAVQAATCLVAGVMTIAMGLASNYPLALAAGMGLNAAVAFQLIAGLRLPWQAAMGVVFLEGIILTALVLTGFREAIMDAIPLTLKRAISVGIGLFYPPDPRAWRNSPPLPVDTPLFIPPSLREMAPAGERLGLRTVVLPEPRPGAAAKNAVEFLTCPGFVNFTSGSTGPEERPTARRASRSCDAPAAGAIRGRKGPLRGPNAPCGRL
jgi:hypothetical protein